MIMLGLCFGATIDKVLMINEPLLMFPYVNMLLDNVMSLKGNVKSACLLC